MKQNSFTGLETRKVKILRILATVAVGVFAILCIFPFVWMLSTSFKYEIDVMEFPIHIIPRRVNTGNYSYVWNNSDFPLYYLNTIKVAVITVIGEITVSTCAAYAYSGAPSRRSSGKRSQEKSKGCCVGTPCSAAGDST